MDLLVAPNAFRISRIATEAIRSSRRQAGCRPFLLGFWPILRAGAWPTGQPPRGAANHGSDWVRKSSLTFDKRLRERAKIIDLGWRIS